MLVALFTLLFLGGDSHPLMAHLDTYEDRAKTTITDKDRREQALNVLKAFEDVTKAREKVVKRTAKQIGATVGDKNSMVADIDAVWDTYFQDVDAYHTALVDSRDELKQYVTRDEWQAIFSPPVTFDE